MTKSTARRIFLKGGAQDHALELFSLNQVQLQALAEHIKKHGVELRPDKVWKAAQSTGLSNETIANLFTIIDYIAEQIQKFEIPNEEIPDEIATFLKENNKDDLANQFKSELDKRDTLIGILGADTEVSNRSKVEYLRAGILPTAYEFASFLDARPDIDKERTLIKWWIPVILFRAKVIDDSGNEGSVYFQMDLDTCKRFINCVDDLKKKIDLLKKQEGQPLQLYEEED